MDDARYETLRELLFAGGEDVAWMRRCFEAKVGCFASLAEFDRYVDEVRASKK